MKKFIKENWLRVTILIILIFFSCTYILSNRYYFIHTEAKEKNIIIRCDKFIGNCQEVGFRQKLPQRNNF
jgi:hypothetical protein